MASLVKYNDQTGGALVNSAETAGSSEGDRLNFRSLASMFRRRLGTFIAVFLTVLVLGILLTLRQTPIYTASAQVALNARVDQITPVGTTDKMPQSQVPSEGYVDTQTAIFISEGMAAKVADKLKLASSPEFTTQPVATGLLARIFGLFGPAEVPAPITPAEARRSAIDYLRSGLTAVRTGTTYAIDLSFRSEDPVEAARIVNAYAEEYTAGALVERQGEASSNLQLIAQRTNQARQVAQSDTNAVQAYRNSRGLLTTSGSTLTEQEISSYNQAVAAARAQWEDDKASLAIASQQLRSGSMGDDVGAALGSGVISSLRNSQTEARGNLAQLTARYGQLHPDVLKAKSQLNAVNEQISAEIKRIISNLDAKQQVSGQRLQSLVGTLGRAQGNLAANNRALPGLTDLEKRAEASNALYESYLSRLKELTAREGTEQADASVLTLATVPTRPTSPNYILNAVLALALGFGLGLAAAFIREMAFSGITTGDDVEHRLGVRYLGTVPTLSSLKGGRGETPATAVVNDPMSAFAESFRSIRASLQFAGAKRGQVIAITSALPQEGKTTTSICLARSMALSGDRVLLVDCDLRQHGVSRFMQKEEGRPGLSEVLRGTAKLEDALVTDEASGMFVLPVANKSVVDAELLTGNEMDALLATLRADFDLIVIDTAPILPIADARLVLGKADMAVFVVRWRSTPDHAIRSAFRLLPTEHVRLAGIILTRVNMRKQSRFGYGDDSFYYQSYKSYYA